MAIGTIVKVIATHVFDAVHGAYPTIQQIDEDLHCIAYRGTDEDGWSKSVNITAAGAISEPASNTLEFDPDQADYCHSCLRPPNIFCIFYRSADNHRYCQAVKVNSDGTLEQHTKHSVRWASYDYTFRHPLHRDGNILAHAYSHSDGNVHVCTIAVSDEGDVTDPVHRDLRPLAGVKGFPSMAHVKDNVHVMMYQDGGNQGWALSVNISETGIISTTGKPQVLTAAQYNWNNHLIKLKDNTFVCVHHGPDAQGWAAVFHCSDTGVVTVPTNNLYVFDAVGCDAPFAIRITDEVFAVAYGGPGTDGFLKTIKCQVASAATWTPISSLEFDPAKCTDAQIIRRNDNVFSIVYCGPGNQGVLKTVEITGAAPALGHTELLMGIGP